MLTLEPLLWKLEVLVAVPHDLLCERGIAAYANDIPIIVSDESQHRCVKNAIKEHKIVAEAKVKWDKSTGLQLSTWRGNAMPSNNVSGRCTGGPARLLVQSRSPDGEELKQGHE